MLVSKSYILFSILFFGCVEKNKVNKEKIEIITNDTIPAIRKNISKKPIAEYIIPIGDPKLDRKFGVKIFETAETFKYLLTMYHDGTIQNDTLTVPNFGIWPVIEVKHGKEKLSCIIGFLGKNKEFKEYKLLYAKGDKLRLTTLHQYGVATYYK
ncbi:MAG TPA: hypothetical protein VGP43_01150 [Chitinophagaceae bacterium]|nr:hypothetical protein [Chitinophagaceae bacterium]